jgi:hypothetical protein
MLGALLYLSAAAAQVIEPETSLRIPGDEVAARPLYRDEAFRANVLKAEELKRRGQELKAFRTLYDAIGRIDDEEKTFAALRRSRCSEGLDGQCVLDVDMLSVPASPAPASPQDLPQLYLYDGQSRTALFSWQPLTGEAEKRIAPWRQLANERSLLACDESGCLQLFDVAPPVAIEGDASSSDLTLKEGLVARPSMAICQVERIGAVVGPPDNCLAILAQAAGRPYVLSVGARDLRPPPPPPPPPPAAAGERDGEEGELLIRVGLPRVSEGWLAKAVEHALASPGLSLSAIATSEYEVRAATAFRNSPVLAPLREWGRFSLDLDQQRIGWLISVRSDLRVTRTNTPRDLRRAELGEVSRYQARIRTAIAAWLRTACRQAKLKCDIPK